MNFPFEDIFFCCKNLNYNRKNPEIEIIENENEIILKDSVKKTKGQLIGRDGSNLRILNEIVGRFFGKEVKVE